MLEFTFDNTVKKISITEDCELSFSLVGGGGGPGGNDARVGSYGVNGDVVNGVVSLKKGDVVYCAVGQRGYAGSGYAGWAPGGEGGSSIDGFSGGRGGNSGPRPWSGAGGGGGGATVLWKNSPTPIFSELTYTNTYSAKTCTYTSATFAAGYLTAPLASSNGFFTRSVSANTSATDTKTGMREYWVIVNGKVVYNGTTPPENYRSTKFIFSAYYYRSDFPGGGDYISFYDFEEIIKVAGTTNNIIAIAAGGGGGGGGGCYSEGYISSRTAYAYSLKSDNTYDTRGAAGQYHQGDGGGGGAGGGGARGGSGGVCGNGDAGGQAGSNGMSFVSTDVKQIQTSVGNPGLYGGNFSWSTYDANTNGYAAFDSLQTNAYIFTRLKTTIKYTNSTTPSFYPKVDYCNAWCGFMNDYSVWSGTIQDTSRGTPSGARDCDLSWRVYFPQTTNYNFEISADNYGYLAIDDTMIVQTQGEGSAFQNVWSASVRVTEGWHTIRAAATNWGGPYGVAGRISYLKQVLTSSTGNIQSFTSQNTVIWTTMSEISPQTQAKYYTPYDAWTYAGYDGALLKPSEKLAINDGANSTYTWNTYFPVSGNYTFSFTLDDVGSVKLDNKVVLDLTSSKTSNWNSINTNTVFVERGYHTITATYTNLGGPGGVAGYVLDNTGKRIWDTRSNYNINALEVEEVSAAGEWKPIREIKYKQNGQWITVPELRVRSNNSWVKTYGNVVNSYVSLNSLMNNTSGPMYPPFPPPPEPVYYDSW